MKNLRGLQILQPKTRDAKQQSENRKRRQARTSDVKQKPRKRRRGGQFQFFQKDKGFKDSFAPSLQPGLTWTLSESGSIDYDGESLQPTSKNKKLEEQPLRAYEVKEGVANNNTLYEAPHFQNGCFEKNEDGTANSPIDSDIGVAAGAAVNISPKFQQISRFIFTKEALDAASNSFHDASQNKIVHDTLQPKARHLNQRSGYGYLHQAKANDENLRPTKQRQGQSSVLYKQKSGVTAMTLSLTLSENESTCNGCEPLRRKVKSNYREEGSHEANAVEDSYQVFDDTSQDQMGCDDDVTNYSIKSDATSNNSQSTPQDNVHQPRTGHDEKSQCAKERQGQLSSIFRKQKTFADPSALFLQPGSKSGSIDNDDELSPIQNQQLEKVLSPTYNTEDSNQQFDEALQDCDDVASYYDYYQDKYAVASSILLNDLSPKETHSESRGAATGISTKDQKSSKVITGEELMTKELSYRRELSAKQEEIDNMKLVLDELKQRQTETKAKLGERETELFCTQDELAEVYQECDELDAKLIDTKLDLMQKTEQLNVVSSALIQFQHIFYEGRNSTLSRFNFFQGGHWEL